MRLFPTHLSVQQLCAILPGVQEPKRTIGDLSWKLPELVTEVSLPPGTLVHPPGNYRGDGPRSRWARKTLLYRFAIHCRPPDVTLRYRIAVWISGDTVFQ